MNVHTAVYDVCVDIGHIFAVEKIYELCQIFLHPATQQIGSSLYLSRFYRDCTGFFVVVGQTSHE